VGVRRQCRAGVISGIPLAVCPDRFVVDES
jgi:hypothetical protein